MKLRKILVIQAADMPQAVEEYCIENEISTHYQNDIALIEDDGNPFAEWLKENGYIFKGKDGDYIGIVAT